MPSTSGSFKEKLAGLKLAVKWTYQSSKFLTISILIITILGGLITIVEPYLFKLIIDYRYIVESHREIIEHYLERTFSAEVVSLIQRDETSSLESRVSGSAVRT